MNKHRVTKHRENNDQSDTAEDSFTQGEKNIRLEQFLKLAGATGSGGQAKILIQSGQVTVNGQVETRRKCQLSVGDTIELLGEKWIVADES